jgi:Amt family ammonium transporter
MGLDITEHGLTSAYADFMQVACGPMNVDYENVESVDISDLLDKKTKLAPIIPDKETKTEGRYTKISIICNEERFKLLESVMNEIGVTGMTVNHVMGCGVQKGKSGQYRGVKMVMNLRPKIQVDIVVSTVPPELVVEAARRALYTGNVGDGKIFVYDVENVVRVRTGESGFDALQETEAVD